MILKMNLVIVMFSDKIIMHFGKYKGKSVKEMKKDPEYVDWLLAQPWFRRRNAPVWEILTKWKEERKNVHN